MSSVVAFTISQLPPSVNNLYFNLPHGRGRAQSREYRAWLELAGAEIRLMQRVPLTKGDVRMGYALKRPNKLSDRSKRIKGLVDALVKFGVIEDDRFIVGYDRLEWADVAGVEVTVRSVSA